MLLDFFIYNVLDVPTSKSYLINNVIDLERLLEDSRLNVFVCQFWYAIFRTFPSPQDYQQLLKQTQITQPSLQSADAILQSLWILRLGLFQKLRLDVHSLLANLHSPTFLKQALLQKLEFRHQVAIKPEKLILSFLENVRHKIQYVPLRPTNPFTGFTVDVAPCEDLYTNTLAHVIHSDNWFLNKLLNYPVVITKTETPIVQYISKKQKCVVFSPSPMPTPNTFQFKLIDDVMHLIPKIVPWCLCIDCEFPLSLDNNLLMSKTSNCPPTFDRLVKTPYDSQSFWDYQLKYKTPQKTRSALDNNLLYIEFIHAYVAKLPPFQLTTDASERLLLLVDNRENELSVFSARAAVHNAPGWHLLILTSEKAKAYYETRLPGARVLAWPSLENHFDIDTYNDVLEDIALWTWIDDNHYTHVLTIQDDGLLLRPGVERFLKYDYVGAPWADVQENAYIKAHLAPNMVGNGGLSLRRTKAMLKVLEEHSHEKHQTFYHNINRMPEDVWFVKYLTQNGAKIPPPEIAAKFSIEETMDYDAIGCHKVWVYNPYQLVQEYFARLLR